MQCAKCDEGFEGFDEFKASLADWTEFDKTLANSTPQINQNSTNAQDDTPSKKIANEEEPEEERNGGDSSDDEEEKRLLRKAKENAKNVPCGSLRLRLEGAGDPDEPEKENPKKPRASDPGCSLPPGVATTGASTTLGAEVPKRRGRPRGRAMKAARKRKPKGDAKTKTTEGAPKKAPKTWWSEPILDAHIALVLTQTENAPNHFCILYKAFLA